MATGYSGAWHDERVAKLLETMLQGVITEIRPQLDSQSGMGLSFPSLSRLLDVTDEESAAILESLCDEGILVRKFFDKFLCCPQCQSMNLRPIYHCSRCGSGDIARGRVLEHPLCKYVGTEDEFLFRGKLICPNCKQELHTLDIDYRSKGVLYQCRDCHDTFNYPSIKWGCLKCASVTFANKISEVNAYSYSLNEEKRNWLGFELKPKSQLIQFLNERGYEVEENAKVQGMSGTKHSFDMLATRDIGVLTHHIAIGIAVAANKVELDRMFDFDDKAYDCGINYKVLIAIPGITAEAERFAERQRIRVLGLTELRALLARGAPPSSVRKGEAEKGEQPFQFKSKSGMINYLQSHGYKAKQYAKAKGESEVEHTFDFLATRDDGIVVHDIAIGIEVAAEPIGIEKVFNFDEKAYDCGILDKVLVAVPGLTKEARRFAERQRIEVFEAKALEPEE
jgi:hypothetical protein